jgi:methyltransferase (TIGR00027 family)
LASSVGATATAVAASRATASQGPNALLDDPWAEPLVRAVGVDTFVKLVDGELTADDDPLLNRKAMNEQIAVRTRFFDDFFNAATASGVRQAVILASGLDTRAYRLPWPAGTVVYEIDQPEVIAFKTQTLADLGAEPTAVRRTVAIDLRDDWPEALRQAGFDADAPTAWSAEGLLVYLPPEAQDRLFDNITELSAPGSQVATEHMDMAGLPDDWADKLTERTKRIGSGINLAELFYTGERNSAADYLASHGWRNVIRSTAEAYAANGFELPDDELATFGGDSGYLTSTRI